MLRVKDILNEKEKVEVERLRIKILKSNSISKSRKYYEKIVEIIQQAKDVTAKLKSTVSAR